MVWSPPVGLSRALLILAAVAAALMLPAFLFGLGASDSAGFNHVWTRQFAAEFGRGELYPRWMPASFEGLGSPAFYFYPPLAFYVSGLLALVLATPTAIAAAGLAFLFGSGAAMYLWLRGRTPRALIGAILYMAAPYHLMDLYMRGALAEFAGFLWLPLLALAVDRLRTRWGPPLLALAYAGLILTHLPLAVLASVFLIAPQLLLRHRRDAKALARAAFAGAIGVLLAAPYLAPALSLQGEIHREVLTTAYFEPGNWSLWRLTPMNAVRLRACALVAAGWSVLALGAGKAARGWLAITLPAAACSLALVPQLWALPVLHDVQFPWRLLAVVEFAAVSAFALAPPNRYLAAAGFTLLIAGYYPMAQTAIDAMAHPLPAQVDRLMTDAVEYLPAGFRTHDLAPGEAPDLSSLRGPLVEGPVTAAAIRPDGGVDLRVSAPGRVTLRRANFPAWRVRGPAGDVPILPGALVRFDARPGRYEIARAALPVERLGLALALMGALLLAGWRAWPMRRRTPAYSSPGVLTV